MLNDIFIAPFVDMFTAPDFLMQVLWEGLVSGILYALIAPLGQSRSVVLDRLRTELADNDREPATA